MTTRQRTLPSSAAAAIIALTAAGSAIGLPTSAHAAVPKVATNWTRLMHRSLTHDTTLATMRTTLATHQAAVRASNAEVAAAAKAERGTRAVLKTATIADANAQARYTSARKALNTAKQGLNTVSKSKSKSRTRAIARAKRAVTAATKTVTVRKSQAQNAAAALSAAGKASRAARARIAKADAAVAAESAAVAKTQNAITALPTAAALATQAAAVSRDVVEQVRPAFKNTDTTKVYGVTVHRNIAFAFKRMIDDAKADGVEISGGGFRTKERQAELRKINGCPDVWTAPSSSCRVPTAIPGRSLHELGLAVDITSGGKTITSKSVAFKWMQAHAKEYGLINFPAEAWHWSISGS
ncbi:D-alanyl-D-alanine carboxypeptidase family protein [Actinoplanes regularis]|nr:D-alanyl-D-alanine carboxypeptidase family protein [Actinoplanes regularis]